MAQAAMCAFEPCKLTGQQNLCSCYNEVFKVKTGQLARTCNAIVRLL